nr:MAG TPA: hypothetical protein [Caudoviricetes sp.]
MPTTIGKCLLVSGRNPWARLEMVQSLQIRICR